MKACRRNRGFVPVILNLGARERILLHDTAALPTGQIAGIHGIGGWETQEPVWTRPGREKSLPLWGFKPRIIQPGA